MDIDRDDKSLGFLVKQKCQSAIGNSNIDNKLIGKIVNPFNGYSDISRNLGQIVKECISTFNNNENISRDDFLNTLVEQISKSIS